VGTTTPEAPVARCTGMAASDGTGSCFCSSSDCYECSLSSPNMCFACKNTMYLYNNSCIASCPLDTTYPVGGGSFFRRCDNLNFSRTCTGRVDSETGATCSCGAGKNCYVCLDAPRSYCLACNNGKYLFGSLCIDSCPAGLLPTGTGNFYRRCVANTTTTTTMRTTTTATTTMASTTTPAPPQPFPASVFRPRFSGASTSNMLFDFEKGYDENLFVFKIKTTATSGLVLFSGPESSGFSDYLAVTVTNGFVEVQVSLSGGEAITARSAQRINTGAWETVWISRSGLMLSVQVNDNAATVTNNGGSMDGLDVRSLLWVGGFTGTLPGGVTASGLDGCLDGLMVDGVDLLGEGSMALVRSSEVQRCEQPQFAGAEQIAFGSGGAAGPMASVSVEFGFKLSTASTGTEVLFYAPAATGGSDSVGVYLANGRVTLGLLYGAGPQQEQLMLSAAATAVAGQWYTVSVMAGNGPASLTVTGSAAVTGAGAQPALGLSGETWLGGVSAAVPAGAVAGLDGLHGCLRNVKINGVYVDYAHATFLSASLTACSA
jgi:hypothetical protein